MHEALKDLEPESVWNYFDKIRQIPRCSKSEEKIVEFVLSAAKDLGLEAKKAEAGNVVIKKPASQGYENHEGVCLQGHLDMVCEKNTDVEHDFSKDPIQLKREGNYIMAKGTTLGSDRKTSGHHCGRAEREKPVLDNSERRSSGTCCETFAGSPRPEAWRTVPQDQGSRGKDGFEETGIVF